jgi:hypothetical protein
VERHSARSRNSGVGWCSSSADEIGGRYYEDYHMGSIVPHEVPISALTEGVRGYALEAKMPTRSDPCNVLPLFLAGRLSGKSADF